MSRPPTEREIHILSIVAAGNGNSDARRIDIDMSLLFEGIDTTMLKELHTLREAGYVTQELGRGGPAVGGRLRQQRFRTCRLIRTDAGPDLLEYALGGSRMTKSVPNQRQMQLLRVVQEGGGDWDARYIDLTMGRRHRPIGVTVLKELQALELAGLVVSDVSERSIGGRWAITSAALPYLQDQIE